MTNPPPAYCTGPSHRGPQTGAHCASSREQLVHARAELVAHGFVTLLRMTAQRLTHGAELGGHPRAGGAVQQMRLHQQGQRLLALFGLQFAVHMRVQMLPHCLTGSGVGGAVGSEWRSGHAGGGSGAYGATRVLLQRWRMDTRSASTWVGQIARHGLWPRRLNG